LLEPELAAELPAIIDRALAEDVTGNDVTTRALIPPDLSGNASFMIKEAGVLAGIEVAGEVLHRVDPALDFNVLVEDGRRVAPGDVVATVTGRVAGILGAERTALNFLQRLSGIATTTARYVAAVQGIDVLVADTRKTTPGLRRLEKYAVKTGGGHNHRMHLGDAVLIKDNHLAALRALGLGLKEIVDKARQNAPKGITVEIEVTDAKEAREALKAGADIIMLDNMKPTEMRQVVKLVSGQAKIEASGGITLDNIHEAAMTGVDIISIGALTHSFRALDISLELEPQALGLL
jgi:nicotinate-nucleotide pyrophosphorylase (carboxylating)